ncbi:MAG: O-antigen ligase family protein, partial [Candidatus Kerfeldbacteria bacterium]|nr:O-antigen ligase family protein [Candidatus Kerfeldbacteria bacterium]
LEGGLLWLLVRALKPKLLIVCWSLTAAGTLQALWAIWQFVTQATFANKWLGVAIHLISQGGTSVVLTQAGLWLRAYAGQVHPNVLGGLLTITSLATAWLYFYSKSQISNLNGQISPKSQIGKSISSYSLLLLYTIQLIGLFFSFSRGAWLALFITLGLWFYRDRPKSVRSRTLAIKTTYGLRNAALAAPDTFRLGMFEFSKGAINILLATVMVFVLLGLWLWQPTVGRFFGGSRLEQQSVEERMGSVGESQSLLKGSWWRGLGYGNYTVALQASQPGLNSWRYQPVHNVFLLILTELGVVGLGLFLWLLWVILSPLTTHFSPPVPVASGYWLVAIIVTALFDHYWWTIPSMMLLFWLVVAIAWLEDSPVSGGS